MTESPDENVDTTVTSVEVIVTTTRNSKAFIASEKLTISNTVPSPQKMYNGAYIARSTGERINSELAAPLMDTIARQFESACEAGETDAL